MLYGIKVLVSSLLIVLITEISKTDTWMGALIKSLPLVSLIAMVWLYVETQDAQRVASLAYGTFWFVLPTLPLFLVFPALVKLGWGFWPSLVIGLCVLLISYGLTMWALRHWSVM